MLATAYGTYPTSQGGDPYRTSPGASNSSHPLPSMRTFDPISQQRPPVPHGGGQAMPYGGQQPMPPGAAHPMHMPPEGFPGYYSPMMGMSQPYGISPESMVTRYNMPPDARYVGHHRPGPKKVRCQVCLNRCLLRGGRRRTSEVMELMLCPPGDQETNQNRLPDMSETKDQGERIFLSSSRLNRGWRTAFRAAKTCWTAAARTTLKGQTASPGGMTSQK